ncbi:MAG: hypothetical protein KDJ73_09335 [Notoacmeibacter sp.]|nr:hypothetical protein [Notoacmeibacter sp.]MCC0032325.1 hypothetical protein [Brucellaceae bacterium]
MPLEHTETNFTEVLDGQAFAMRNGAMRVIVIVANETLVRMNMPEDMDRQGTFLTQYLPFWQEIAIAKYSAGKFENRGTRLRISPADVARHLAQAAA